MIKKKEKQERKRITKKMSFAEIMQKEPKAAAFLMERGMHCMGCPMAMQESLEAGAMAHGIDPDKLEKELNEKLKKKKEKIRENEKIWLLKKSYSAF